jgi:hypothetical protein
VHVNDYRSILQVQIHVLSKIGLCAVQTETFQDPSPFNVFFSQAAPALSANWQFLSFEKNVQFDVLALALVIPRILTTLQADQSPSSFGFNCFDKDYI